MSYEIIKTSNGPIIKHNDNLITLSDNIDLFDVAEENPEFLEELKKHIAQTLMSLVDEFVDGFTSGISGPTQPIFSYLTAVNQYNVFAFNQWPQYRQSISDAKKAP